MNCLQVNSHLRFSLTTLTKAQWEELESHAGVCIRCAEELALNKMLSVLMTNHVNLPPETANGDDLRIIYGIRSRIREISQQGSGSWDMAIIAVKGWLLAFAAAAILLLFLSREFATSHPLDISDRDQINPSVTAWNEDIVSSNSSSLSILGEEPEHAH